MSGTVRAVAAGRCLDVNNSSTTDVAGAGTANGTEVQLWACTGASSQQWRPGGEEEFLPPEFTGDAVRRTLHDVIPDVTVTAIHDRRQTGEPS